MILEPGKLLGERYEIIKRIGAGGMSIVYLAKCNKLNRYVAIKVLRDEFARDEDFVKKFRAEAFSAGSLSHPNIVGIYDVGSEEDLHYIVMEYIEGKTLKEVIEEQGKIAPQMALQYGMQIVSALRHAHKKQIIHRDIKPQNILVTQDNELKVTDFGIARAVNASTIVATGNAIGSVHYFSPEQAKGKYVNETSDLYSCGIVLFEMVTGRLPFQADSHVSIALKHINEDIPKPSEIVPEIWDGLEHIILKATSKKQDLRYQQADEMLEDMKKVLQDPYVNLVPIDEDVMEQTILLSETQTDEIRKGSTQKQLVEALYDEDDAMEEDEEPIPTFYKILVGLGGMLATLVILGIVAFAVFFSWPSKAKTQYVVVPQVVGSTLEEATQLLKTKGLVLEVIEEKEDDTLAPGQIISQDPQRETLLETNGVVKVVVAKESLVEMSTIPDVRGIDGGEAQRQLIERGFIPVIERAYHETLEMGKVIEQDPAPNSELPAGSRVTLILSKGPELTFVKMPNLYNLSLEQAKLALKNEGLTLGATREVYHETIEAGFVVDQSIQVNRDVEKGTVIDITLSKGKEVQEVPEEEPEQTPEPTPSEEVTLTRYIEDPKLGKESYHVLVMLETPTGVAYVFDKQVKTDDFPVAIQVKGSGYGLLITYFDGVEQYRDMIQFNEVTQQ